MLTCINIKIFEELHLNTSGLCSVITMNNNYTDVSRHMLRKADELHVHCTYSLIQKVACLDEENALFSPFYIFVLLT